jgi:hypothetical protein
MKMQTVFVRLKGTGVTHELYPAAAEGFVATGAWEIVDPKANPSAPPVAQGKPTIEATVLLPVQETAVIGSISFRVGPRSAHNAAK